MLMYGCTAKGLVSIRWQKAVRFGQESDAVAVIIGDRIRRQEKAEIVRKDCDQVGLGSRITRLSRVGGR